MTDNAGEISKSSLVALADTGGKEAEGSGKSEDKVADPKPSTVTLNEHATEDEDKDETENDDDDAPMDVDSDAMDEIDPSNIIADRRTRGRVIDFAKVAEQTPVEEEDDEEEDEDFHAVKKSDED